MFVVVVYAIGTVFQLYHSSLKKWNIHLYCRFCFVSFLIGDKGLQSELYLAELYCELYLAGKWIAAQLNGIAVIGINTPGPPTQRSNQLSYLVTSPIPNECCKNDWKFYERTHGES